MIMYWNWRTEPRPTDSRPPVGRLLALLIMLLTIVGGDRPAYALNLWPLLEFSDRRQTVLYPLYQREGKSVLMFPFYYQTNKGRDQHVLWPLIKVSDSRLTRIFPFYFKNSAGEKTSEVLWPLYQLERTSETMRLRIPSFLACLAYNERTPERSRAGVLLWFTQNFEYEGNAVHQQALLPIWYHEVGKGPSPSSKLWLLPYWRVRSANQSEDKVFPFYSRSTYTSAAGLSKTFWIMPYYHDTSPHETVHGLFPFFRKGQSTDTVGNTTSGGSILWPCYGFNSTRNGNGELITERLRWLFVTRTCNKEGESTTRIFGMPVHKKN